MKVLDIRPSSLHQYAWNTFVGTIEAAAVHFISTRPYQFSGYINTSNDVLSTLLHHKKIKVSNGSVLIQSYAEAPFIFKSKIQSDVEVNIQSSTDLLIESGVNIQAPKASFMAKNRLENHANAVFESIDMAGKNVENTGRLRAPHHIDIYADQILSNRFGGILSAHAIHLESKHSVVRNGSLYPYFTDYVASKKLKASLNDRNRAQMGTFYQSQLNPRQKNRALKRSDLSAHILGSIVTIKAKSVENINPYYVHKNALESWNHEIPIRFKKANQVSISAEKTLLIQAKTSVINSSAIMRVNTRLGKMRIQTPILSNERYRTLVVLKINLFYGRFLC
jgi:hypothetical protein